MCVYPVIYLVLLSLPESYCKSCLFGWLLASHSALHFQLGLMLMSQKFCSNSSLLSPLIWRCHDVRPSWRRIQRQSPRPLEMRLYMPISSHVSMLSWAVCQYTSTRFHGIFWIYWCTCWLWNLNLLCLSLLTGIKWFPCPHDSDWSHLVECDGFLMFFLPSRPLQKGKWSRPSCSRVPSSWPLVPGSC